MPRTDRRSRSASVSRDKKSKRYRRDAREEQKTSRKSSPSERKRHRRSSSNSSGGSSVPKTHKPYKRDRHSNKLRKSSRSSSGSPDSDRSDLDEKLRMKRQRELEEKKRLKERAKLMETPEQKRARRLQKKLEKEQKLKQSLGWDEECIGYSNTDNPFGDSKLTETFMWRKKLEKEGLGNAPVEVIELKTREKLMASKEELEKVKRLRLERERLKAEREKESEIMQREKELSQFKEWSVLESEFHLQQARMRSKLRIKEHRAKPIDLLARYIDEEEDDLEVEMHEPSTYLKGLTKRDVEDLIEDIKVYRELEKGKNDDYWKDLDIIAKDELQKLQRIEDERTNQSAVGRREGIHHSVRKDVAEILKGKTLPQLALLETEIRKKIKAGAIVDTGFYETLLEQLKVSMAKARLRDLHQETLRRKLLKLKEEQGVAEVPEESRLAVKPELDEVECEPSTSRAVPQSSDHVTAKDQEDNTEDDNIENLPWELLSDEQRKERAVSMFNDGGYSPQYVAEEQLPPAVEIVDPNEDRNRLLFARQKFKESGIATAQQDAALELEARKGMTNDEAQFSVEMPLEKKSYLWSDKYRPRKPRYFNRVHTGFEWNKYNQTHYDLDNPPPKIVQGYKFNIFYPDLLDPMKAPEYTLVQCDDNPDFAILRFHAGPPYEDIGFKVVNREWEVSHKRGFRCQFQNGVFQLWFHFKKYRYRR